MDISNLELVGMERVLWNSSDDILLVFEENQQAHVALRILGPRVSRIWGPTASIDWLSKRTVIRGISGRYPFDPRLTSSPEWLNSENLGAPGVVARNYETASAPLSVPDHQGVVLYDPQRESREDMSPSSSSAGSVECGSSSYIGSFYRDTNAPESMLNNSELWSRQSSSTDVSPLDLTVAYGSPNSEVTVNNIISALESMPNNSEVLWSRQSSSDVSPLDLTVASGSTNSGISFNNMISAPESMLNNLEVLWSRQPSSDESPLDLTVASGSSNSGITGTGGQSQHVGGQNRQAQGGQQYLQGLGMYNNNAGSATVPARNVDTARAPPATVNQHSVFGGGLVPQMWNGDNNNVGRAIVPGRNFETARAQPPPFVHRESVFGEGHVPQMVNGVQFMFNNNARNVSVPPRNFETARPARPIAPNHQHLFEDSIVSQILNGGMYNNNVGNATVPARNVDSVFGNGLVPQIRNAGAEERNYNLWQSSGDFNIPEISSHEWLTYLTRE